MTLKTTPNTRLWDFLASQVAPYKGPLPMMWVKFLSKKGYTKSPIQKGINQYLGSLGYTGTFAKRWGKWYNNIIVKGNIVPFTLAINAREVQLGDSITAQGFTQNNNFSRTLLNLGFTTFADMMSGNKLYVPPTGNQGVTGDTLAQILARIATSVALLPDFVSFMAGINSITGNVALATMTSQFDSIIASFPASVKWQIYTVLPTFGVSALTGPQETVRLGYNNYLRAWVATNSTRAILTDCELLNITASDLNSSDGKHPNKVGAYRIGRQGALDRLPYLASGRLVDVAPVGIFSLDPTMGTGVSSPTNWANGGVTNITGPTILTDLDGTGRRKISGAGVYSANTSPRVDLTQTRSNPIPSPSTGALLELVADFDIMSDTSGVNNIGLLYQVVAAGSVNMAQGVAPSTAFTEGAMPYKAGNYVIRTPIVAMDTGTVAQISSTLRVGLSNAGGTLGIDLRINYIGLRQIA